MTWLTAPWSGAAAVEAAGDVWVRPEADSATGFRFMVLFDRAVQQDVAITLVEVFYEMP